MKFTPLIKRLCISMAVAVVILVADYLIGNFIYTLFDDSITLALTEHFFPHDDTEDSDVFHIDASLDKQLAPVLDEYNDTIGYIPITDRQKLYDFLSMARTADYRYIFMDIRFEQGTDTPIDSALFSLITSMPRLVISTHADDNYTIADSSLLQKAAYADYKSTLFSGFTKYEYIQHGQESVPLRMYRELDGGNIAKHGLIYSSHGSLCNNAQFITFTADDKTPIKLNDDTYVAPPIKYQRLGAEILTFYTTPDEIAKLISGKIVIIGDYQNDIHTTYVGPAPGPVINYHAYRALHDGNHTIKWWRTILLFLIYTTIAYLTIYFNITAADSRLRRFAARHSTLTFLILALGWGNLLYILKVIVFLTFHTSLIISIPAFIFSELGMPSNYKKFKSDIPN